MANRERKNELKIYLSDDEQYILEQKVKSLQHEKQIRFPAPPNFIRFCLWH